MLFRLGPVLVLFTILCPFATTATDGTCSQRPCNLRPCSFLDYVRQYCHASWSFLQFYCAYFFKVLLVLAVLVFARALAVYMRVLLEFVNLCTTLYMKCICTCVWVYAYVYMYVYAYVYRMCVCMRIGMNMPVYIYTYCHCCEMYMHINWPWAVQVAEVVWFICFGHLVARAHAYTYIVVIDRGGRYIVRGL